jgi:hypothetical protein
MAQTQEQWFHKISTFIPSWMLDKGPTSLRSPSETERTEALLMGLAKVASLMEAEVYSQLAQTYLEQAADAVLDLHGSERSVERFTGETDASFLPRIKAFGATFNEVSIENAMATLVDDTYVEYTTIEIEEDGPWLGVSDIFLPGWASGLTKIYNRGLIEIFPTKTVIDTDTTIAVGEELEAAWLVVAQGVTLTVEGTLSASFVRGPGTVTNSGGTIQTYAAYDAYVAANKTDIYTGLVEFLSNNKALGVFVAVQSYLESGI